MIRILEKQVADKIAAGEVVERPVSIVKELIENSIDAGSKSIVCEIKKGGKEYIRITDDGCGIPENEVETAFLRHATSKITNIDDLDSLITLGFRGEALASIAAVSRLDMITRTKDEKSGVKLMIEGGEIVNKQAIGCPEGTSIIVRDLFYNTPARFKFMKSDGAESTLIINLISELALAYKYIKFRLISNGKTVFSTNGNGNRLDIISNVYPSTDIRNLTEVESNNDQYSISGYISTPIMTRTTKQSQVFFVNGRVVNSKVIEKGLKEGYKERLFEGREPLAYLFLETKPNALDVNIHPNKREVRFDYENEVIDFIANAVVEALGTKEATVDAGNIFTRKDKNTFSQSTKTHTNVSELYDQSPKEEQISVLNDHILGINSNKDGLKEFLASKKTQEEPAIQEEVHNIEILPPLSRPFDFNTLEYKGIIFDTYIIFCDKDSFYLVDQHACHERVFYEKFVSDYNNRDKMKQVLLVPIIIDVDHNLLNMDFDWQGELDRMGFSLEIFGDTSYKIYEIPTYMSASEAENFVLDFLDGVKDNKQIRNYIVYDKIIMRSCKSAIKAHDKINEKEVKALINELSNCVNPFSCPHGRPTFIKMSKYEIEKLFKRIQ
ncbi:MAG: DNA mismatch repair endonuclease MutL [Clostridia bacterium]|nr:DNA mismatch repair endonuclease MutL [Clostridia bacterium]